MTSHKYRRLEFRLVGISVLIIFGRVSVAVAVVAVAVEDQMGLELQVKFEKTDWLGDWVRKDLDSD